MANNKIYSDYLMHYRTKGSRNGYSKDPNYTPVGKKAMDPLDYDSRDASIDTNRKRIQQARADREYANRTRYSQQEAIEATKAGHGKAPTNGKSGRLTAGFATADAASSVAKAGIDGRDNAFRERAIARVKADAMGRNASDMAKKSKVAYYHNELEKSKKISDKRNSRSDIGNAIADAKSDAKRFVNKGKKKVSKLLKKFR